MSFRPSLAAALAAFGLLAGGAAHAGAATDYCKQTGGAPSRVNPYANTNSAPHLWMQYGGAMEVCTYAGVDENGYTSHISVFASTLQSTQPSMAALAYYAKLPWDGKGFGNPATLYCIQLGGTEQIGAIGSGSGWATRPGAEVHNMCVFADLSAIDDWGLLYHSSGIVRGIELAAVLRFASPY